jgi:hypothetical protein
MNNTNGQKLTILYERLSKEDSRADQSLSIENQKKILENYATENGFTPFVHLSDDGASGANFQRSGWQELIARVEAGEVGAILLKTLDRMGRDYLRAGLYREMFHERGVRLIAVGDNFDSDKGGGGHSRGKHCGGRPQCRHPAVQCNFSDGGGRACRYRQAAIWSPPLSAIRSRRKRNLCSQRLNMKT